MMREHRTAHRGNINPSVISDNRDGTIRANSERELVFPDQVKIYPGLFEKAIDIRAVDSLRVWALARALDPQGSGTVSKSALLRFMNKLEVNSRTRDRWIQSARNHGLFTPYARQRSGERGYVIAGLERAAQLLGIPNVGRFPVLIPSTVLVRKGYRSYLWGGTLQGFENRPISRKHLRQQTGVPERTQRRREKTISVKIIHNISLTEMPPEHLDGIRDLHEKPAFVYHRRGQQPAVAYRLPDIRVVDSSEIIRIRVGKCKRTNDALRTYQPKTSFNAAWLSWGPGLSVEAEGFASNVRMYYNSEDQATDAKKRLIKKGANRSGLDEIYECTSAAVSIVKRPECLYNIWRPISLCKPISL